MIKLRPLSLSQITKVSAHNVSVYTSIAPYSRVHSHISTNYLGVVNLLIVCGFVIFGTQMHL